MKRDGASVSFYSFRGNSNKFTKRYYLFPLFFVTKSIAFYTSVCYNDFKHFSVAKR